MSEQFPWSGGEGLRGGGGPDPDPDEARRLAEQARWSAANQPAGSLGQGSPDAPAAWLAPGEPPTWQAGGGQPASGPGGQPAPPASGQWGVVPQWQAGAPQSWQGQPASWPGDAQPGSRSGDFSGQPSATPVQSPPWTGAAAQGSWTSAQPASWQGAPGAGTPVGAQPAARQGRSLARVLVAVGAALLVLVLAVVAATRMAQRHPTPPAPAASSPTPTPSASTTSPTPSASPTPAAAASGALGRAAEVLTRLSSLGFTCTDEGLSLYTSRFCTHLKDSPPLMAYVASDADGTLHRLSLYSAEPDATRSAETLALQHQFIQWMVPAADVAHVESAVRAGHRDKYAAAAAGTVEASGSGNGSVVLKTKGWQPSVDLPTLPLLDNRTPLAARLTKAGLTCVVQGVTTCTRTDKASRAVQSLAYWGEQNDPSWLYLRVTAPRADAARKAYDSLTATVFPLFVDSTGLTSFNRQHSREPGGASEYHDHMLFEVWSDPSQMVFRIGAPCWADVDPDC